MRVAYSPQLRLDSVAVEKVRADSFAMETNIHYPTESALLYDGLRRIINLCVALTAEHNFVGWRQHKNLLKKVKKLDRQINRIAAKKGPRYKARMKPLYRELLEKTALITQQATEFCVVAGEPEPCPSDMFGDNTLQAFIVRTQRVADTATRRVIKEQSVCNADKLFSIFGAAHAAIWCGVIDRCVAGR